MKFRIVQWWVFLLLLLHLNDAFSQFVFEQDIVQGGITAAGFSTGQGSGSGSFDIYIEPGSTIKKAYVFSYSLRFPPIAEFTLNNMSFTFDTSNVIMDVGYYAPATPYGSPVRLYFKELTGQIDAETTNYNVTIPFQPNLPINAGYWTLFLVVVYENSELNQTAYSIIINDQNLTGLEIYAVDQLNPILVDYPVSFSLYTDRSGLGTPPTKIVRFNSNFLGVVGGSDNVNSSWNRGGVKGHFYYQNNQMYGLDDDIPNSIMSGTDGLADVSSFISQNTSSVAFEIEHSNYPNHPINSTQVNLAYTLAYTTPCIPFETTLTEEITVCRGDTAQLLADGGINYDWLPQEDLSCYNCPNPVFEGDSSKIYTVRIWNTDSCSKVLPVKVNVIDAPQNVNIATNPATCSESNGELVINSVVGGASPYQFSINEGDEDFNELESGEYTLTVVDANGCTLEELFTIEEFNPAHAAFTANPQSGTEPLEVDFSNQSSGTNQYEWTVQDSISNDFDFNFTFDSAGTYLVQLIAWNNEPHCADTAMATIIVHPTPPDYSHSIFMPTLYNLEIGDFFIETTNVQRVEFEIYNAIGQHIFSTTLDVADGKNEIWNGSRHAQGYYFFRLKYWDMQGVEFRERGKVLVVR